MYSLRAYTQIHAVRHLQLHSDIVCKYVARSESWQLLQSPHVMPASNRTTYLLSVAAKKQISCVRAPSSVNLHADESVWDIWGSKNAAVSQNSKASLGIKILFIGNEGRKILHPISLMFLIPLHMLRHYGCASSSARLIFPEHIWVPAWSFYFSFPQISAQTSSSNREWTDFTGQGELRKLISGINSRCWVTI